MLTYPDSNFAITLLLAWLINMFITGIFAFAGFALPTQKLLPASYYYISNPALLQRICKPFRVELFRKFLLLTLWRGKQHRNKYFNGTSAGIAKLMEQSMKFGVWPPDTISTYRLTQHLYNFKEQPATELAMLYDQYCG